MSEFYKCIFCGACENDDDEPLHAWLCEPVIGDDDVGVKWFVECGRCGARGSVRSSRQEAIETWNSINRIFNSQTLEQVAKERDTLLNDLIETSDNCKQDGVFGVCFCCKKRNFCYYLGSSSKDMECKFEWEGCRNENH